MLSSSQFSWISRQLAALLDRSGKGEGANSCGVWYGVHDFILSCTSGNGGVESPPGAYPHLTGSAHIQMSLSRFMVYGMMRLWYHATVTGGTTHGPSTGAA